MSQVFEESLPRRDVQLVLKHHFGQVTRTLIGKWISGDGSFAPYHSWYEARYSAWFFPDGGPCPTSHVTAVAALLLPLPGETEYPVVRGGWLACGRDFEGKHPTGWVQAEGPYRTIDEAVDAAMAEYEQ